MGPMRLARAVTMFAAGAATAWYLDRRRPLPDVERAEAPPPWRAAPADTPPPAKAEEQPPRAEQEHDAAPPDPPPDPPPARFPRRGPPPVPDVGSRRREVYSPPDEVFAAPSEQPTVEQPALQRGAEPTDVAAVVDDLIASGDPEEDEPPIVDAEVVEERVSAGPPDDPRITVGVLVELGKVPGLRPEAVAVEVTEGVVWLHGEIEDPAVIVEVERRIAALEGVERLRSVLHLPVVQRSA